MPKAADEVAEVSVWEFTFADQKVGDGLVDPVPHFLDASARLEIAETAVAENGPEHGLCIAVGIDHQNINPVQSHFGHGMPSVYQLFRVKFPGAPSRYGQIVTESKKNSDFGFLPVRIAVCFYQKLFFTLLYHFLIFINYCLDLAHA